MKETSVPVVREAKRPDGLRRLRAEAKSGSQAAAFQMQLFLGEEYSKKDDSSRKKIGNA